MGVAAPAWGRRSKSSPATSGVPFFFFSVSLLIFRQTFI
jgi:hypothetical protein